MQYQLWSKEGIRYPGIGVNQTLLSCYVDGRHPTLSPGRQFLLTSAPSPAYICVCLRITNSLGSLSLAVIFALEFLESPISLKPLGFTIFFLSQVSYIALTGLELPIHPRLSHVSAS